MAFTPKLTYKGRPLVRCKNDIYYGSLSDPYVIFMQVLTSKEENGVQVAYGRCVPYIINRENTGLCPMEQRVRDIRDPADAYEALAAQAGGQTAP